MIKNYRIKNLDCANCANKIETKLKKIKNIDDVSINFITGKMILESQNIIDIDEIKNIITSIESNIDIEEIIWI